jgi:16S rRNA processing protein RimM
VRFVGVDDRDEAAQLRGASLEIETELVPPSPPGSYYYYQLVGCRCQDRGSGHIGEVAEVIEDGGGLLLSVVTDGCSFLIPFVEDFIKLIDLDERRIEMDLPAGLLELCASPS